MIADRLPSRAHSAAILIYFHFRPAEDRGYNTTGRGPGAGMTSPAHRTLSALATPVAPLFLPLLLPLITIAIVTIQLHPILSN